MKKRSLRDCDISKRLVYSSFLVLMEIGYLMGMAYLYSSHQWNDGKPGLSVMDVAENYYGNRSGTRLEASIRGSMAAYISDEDRSQVVAWLKSGAQEDGYEAVIKPVLEDNCVGCHSPSSSMRLSDLSNYKALREVADIDTGASILTLVKISHIHLFGIGLVLFAVGMIFHQAVLRTWVKIAILLAPFFAALIDILSWFLMKWDPFYAYIVVIAGAVLGLSLSLQTTISLYQIWFGPKTSD